MWGWTHWGSRAKEKGKEKEKERERRAPSSTEYATIVDSMDTRRGIVQKKAKGKEQEKIEHKITEEDLGGKARA